MMESFVYNATPIRVIFGRGTLPRVAEEAQRLKCTRLLVVASPGQRDLAEHVGSLLGASCVQVHAGAEMHTPVGATQEALQIVEAQRVDGLVAVGGGSAIGLSKALAYRTGLPQLAIPTTYAGSEATSILGQTENGAKTTLKDEKVAVKTILYDVALTETLPLGLSVTSAINAMAHAVEALYSADVNPVVELMATGAVSTIRSSLPVLAQELPSQTGGGSGSEALKAARSELLCAAWLCGSCLGSVGMGLHHKLCHTVGGSLNTPHADTHAIILPHALQYNFRGLAPRVAALFAKALLGEQAGAAAATGGGDSEATAVRCAQAIFDLVKLSGGATSLRELGVKETDLDKVADAAAHSKPYPNPVPLEAPRLKELLRRAWAGERPSPGL